MSPGSAFLRLALAFVALLSTAAQADDLFMVRAPQPFPETMTLLQQTIKDHGYTVSRVQRVDIGLTSSGYQTAEYRIVFFGKAEEVKTLAARYPELMPYLPLKIVIFAEGDSTVMTTNNPELLKDYFPAPELRRQFERWCRDVGAIFDTLAGSE